MTRPKTFYPLLILLAVLIWLLVVGYPGRHVRHGEFGLPGLLRARSAAGFLRARNPDGGAPDLISWAARSADRLEEGLVQLSYDLPSVGHLARSSARLRLPTLVVPERDPLAPSRALALRPVAALGDRGLELLRCSERNLERFPRTVREALAGLVETVNGISRLLEEQIRSGGDAEARAVAADRLLGQVRTGSLAAFGSDPELAALLGRFDPELPLELLIELSDRLDHCVPILKEELTPTLARSLTALPEGDGVPRGLLVLARIEAGLVIVGGPRTTILPQNGVALTIDLGGDDRWVGGVSIGDLRFPEPLVRVGVDLGGNDRYQGRGGQLAGCIQGLSILLDLKGDDTYESAGLEFGAALFGAALLVDRGGRDSYRCRVAGVGCGLGGLGILFDAGEDDRFQVEFAGLGFGSAGGVGVLVDHWGDDLYLALAAGEGEDGGRSGTAVLGAGFPLRPGLSAGLGLVLDRRGADVYRAGARSLGSASGGGLGCLLEGGGDDLYSSGDESLGSGTDGGFGYLRDLAGDDEYLSRVRSQGFGAAAVGLFIDDDGQDRFLCLSPSQGSGARGGAGLHADLGGR